jgi:aldose 1-epimerase
MSIANFGEIDGTPVHEIRLRADSGAEASLISFGATLRDLLVPLADGKRRRVILGYETMKDYRTNAPYFGATCGRVANRIAQGSLPIDGKTYQLSLNEDGRTHLHGGTRGFSHRLWEIADHGADHATFRRVSPDGEEGYPGRVEVFCRYRLLPPATLQMEFTASAEAPTVVNIVNHAYFTLAENRTVFDHTMRIAADFYTPVDDALIPTGEICRVAGTPFDFREFRRIGMTAGTGSSGAAPFEYDINFVLKAPAIDTEDLVAASVIAPEGDLRLDLVTSQPGLQFYSGAGIGTDAAGIDGQRHFPNAGFCLEAQHFPDAAHHRHFPSTSLHPGEVYRQATAYRFSIPTAS